ncbi:MAG: flavodoxin family protein [Campylobacter sp.]|nr:flavodoxin family protein [Campylobacter sp.]
MKKVIIINASPRKNFNTAEVLKSSEKGAQSVGAETEFINLGDVDFKGCISCFACKRKGKSLGGLCAVKDGAREILEKIINADALIIGSPIYDFYPTGMFRNLLERMLFASGSYMIDENGNYIMNLKKKIPVGLIYTMNATKEQVAQYNMEAMWSGNELGLKMVYRHCETLLVCDTYQFKDYSKYDCNMFSEPHKKMVRDTQFPIDLDNAFELGKRLTQMEL